MRTAKLCCVALLLGALLLYSCWFEDGKVQTFDVVCEAFCDEDYILGKPNQMALSDSILAVIDSGSDSLVHFFNVNKCSFLSKIGHLGQGPNEFLAISSLVSTDSGFAMYDPNKRKYFEINCEKGTVVITPIYSIDALAPLSIQPLSPNRYLSTGIYRKSKFCFFDANGKVISLVGDWPYRDEKEKNISNHIKAQAYMSNIAISPSKENVMSYSMTADLLSFYEVENDSLILLKEYIKRYPEYDYSNSVTSFSGTSKGTPITYLAGASTKEYVYILYSGKSTLEYKESAFLGDIIYVYSWNGVMVAKIRIDKPLNSFCIDEKRNVAYAVAYMPEPTLVNFTLPQF